MAASGRAVQPSPLLFFETITVYERTEALMAERLDPVEALGYE